MSTGQTETILVIEDDEVDRMSVRRSLAELGLANPLAYAADGVEALAMLRGEGGHDALTPLLILLDLNMPRMNGVEFLDQLRSDDALKDTTVFIMTTSDADKDIRETFARDVAGYIVKSDAKDGLREAVESLDWQWMIVKPE